MINHKAMLIILWLFRNAKSTNGKSINFSPIYAKPTLFAKIEKKLKNKRKYPKTKFKVIKTHNDTWTSSENSEKELPQIETNSLLSPRSSLTQRNLNTNISGILLLFYLHL